MALTSIEYAALANAAYLWTKEGVNIARMPSEALAFKVYGFHEGMQWGATNTDYKGLVFQREATNEVVVAIQGTVPKKLGDIVADIQIVLGVLPHYCQAAARLLRRTREAFPGSRISLTGHSLGGGLAQVLGHWTGLPFVTFNAPGMWGDIQKVKFLGFDDENFADCWKGTFTGAALGKVRASTGRNFRCFYDVVSAYGSHYGPVTRLYYNSGLNSHSMDKLYDAIKKKSWKDKHPLDVQEWGELK